MTYKKSSFTLRSGNSPLFKHVGSSPVKAEKKEGKKNRIRPLTSDELKKRKINPKKDTEYYIDDKGNVSTSTTLKKEKGQDHPDYRGNYDEVD